MLQEFVSEVNTENGGDAGIQVYIGDETPVQSMKDCSVVTANYDLGGGLRGNSRNYRTEAYGIMKRSLERCGI